MKRPFSVTLLALGVLLFAAYNAWRVIAVLQQFDFMQSLGLRTQAILLMVIGAAWSIGFSLAAIGLWRLQAWGRHWMIIALIAYAIQFWIERLTLEQSPYEQLTRPADAAITLIVAVSTIGYFFLPNIRRAFKTEQT